MENFDLQQLILNKQNENLKLIFQDKPSLALVKTSDGISLLQFAAYCRNYAATKLLLHYQEDLNLFEAVVVGNLDLVKEKIEKQAELVNTLSEDGFSALGLACFFGYFEIAQYLITHQAIINQVSANDFKVTPLHSAVAIGNLDLTQLLLDHGADPNARQQKGITALHSAAHNGHIAIVQLLINQQADTHATMEDGQTPAMLAAAASFHEIINLLNEKKLKY